MPGEPSDGGPAWAPSVALIDVLATAQRRGAIGEVALEAHITHALGYMAIWPALAEAGAVLDLGSGGGLPGLVLAARLPTVRFVLLDGRVERARMLREEVARLGWSERVEVIAERAEVAAHEPRWRGRFDAVVARSFGRPAVTAECAAGFLSVGGALVVSAPPGAEGATRWPPAALAELGLVPGPSTTTPLAFSVLRQVTPCPDRYPRRVGVPERRQLF